MNLDLYLIPIIFVGCGVAAFAIAIVLWWLERDND